MSQKDNEFIDTLIDNCTDPVLKKRHVASKELGKVLDQIVPEYARVPENKGKWIGIVQGHEQVPILAVSCWEVHQKLKELSPDAVLIMTYIRKDETDTFRCNAVHNKKI